MGKNVPFLFRFCFCLTSLSAIQYIYTQTLYMVCYLKAVMWKSSGHVYFSAIKNLYNSKGSGSFMALSSIYLLTFLSKALSLTPRLLRPPHNTSQTKEKLPFSDVNSCLANVSHFAFWWADFKVGGGSCFLFCPSHNILQTSGSNVWLGVELESPEAEQMGWNPFMCLVGTK